MDRPDNPPGIVRLKCLFNLKLIYRQAEAIDRNIYGLHENKSYINIIF